MANGAGDHVTVTVHSTTSSESVESAEITSSLRIDVSRFEAGSVQGKTDCDGFYLFACLSLRSSRCARYSGRSPRSCGTTVKVPPAMRDSRRSDHGQRVASHVHGGSGGRDFDSPSSRTRFSCLASHCGRESGPPAFESAPPGGVAPDVATYEGGVAVMPASVRRLARDPTDRR